MITRKEIEDVNRRFREAGWAQLNCWPLRNGNYPNWPEPVIRKARWFRAQSQECGSVLEYELLLDAIASDMVNDESRW